MLKRTGAAGRLRGVPGNHSVAARWFFSLVIAALAVASCGGDQSSKRAGEPDQRPTRAVLIVLDTVRADRLSACGHSRPTSPFLDGLWENADYATCNAYSPGSWTLPSHASFFTGLPIEEHGAVSSPSGDKGFRWGARYDPLRDDFETLAETFALAGFRTVLVSANPVVGPPSGLAQGFERQVVAEGFLSLRGERLADAIDRELEGIASTDDLFLVVNIADAHNPWSKIPVDLGWLEPAPSLGIPAVIDAFRMHAEGSLSDEHFQRAKRHYRDVYDYAVFRADQTLRAVFESIGKAGVFTEHHDWRVAVTSDHGELLFEHDNFGHGGSLWEGVMRVPLLFFSSRPDAPPQYAEPVSAIEVYSFLLGQRREPSPVTATSNWRTQVIERGADYPQFRERSAAVWLANGHKVIETNGVPRRYDLASDPLESHPLRQEVDEHVELLRAILARAEETRQSGEHSEDLLESLRALGYVD